MFSVQNGFDYIVWSHLWHSKDVFYWIENICIENILGWKYIILIVTGLLYLLKKQKKKGTQQSYNSCDTEKSRNILVKMQFYLAFKVDDCKR